MRPIFRSIESDGGNLVPFNKSRKLPNCFISLLSQRMVFTQPHKRYSGPLLGNQRHWSYHSIFWRPPTPVLQHPDLVCSYPLTVFRLLHHLRTYLGNGLSVKILYCGISLNHRMMKGLNFCSDERQLVLRRFDGKKGQMYFLHWPSWPMHSARRPILRATSTTALLREKNELQRKSFFEGGEQDGGEENSSYSPQNRSMKSCKTSATFAPLMSQKINLSPFF